MDSSQVPIARAIEALRSELEAAMEGSAGRSLKFEPTKIELELNACVTQSAEVGGGVKWWLIDASAKGAMESVVSQRVFLTLTPVVSLPDGTNSRVLLEGDGGAR